MQIPSDAVIGSITYDLYLNYEDGSSDKFTSKVSLPSFPLGSVSQGEKNIKTIDLIATSSLNVPQVQGLSDTYQYEGLVTVSLGKNALTSKTFALPYATQGASSARELYHLTIPASDIRLQTGTYDLVIQSKEHFRFMVNGVTKDMTVTAVPTVGLSNSGATIKPIYVMTNTAGGMAQLSQECRGPLCNAYYWNIDYKASGFAPNSSITYQFKDLSISQDNELPGRSLVLQAGHSAIETADLTGSAIHRVSLPWGFSTPDCYTYYAHFKISDGSGNSFGPAMSGCSFRQFIGQAEQFVSWESR